jgi:OCT family organic cation transporter-like MFS transporter 4/5
VATVNGKIIPSNFLAQIQKVGKKVCSEKKSENEKSPLDLIKKPRLRSITLMITFNWIAADAAYAGLHYNATNLSGNEFLNFFLLAIVEVPSLFVGWYLMETKFGRRWTNTLCLMGCGVFLCIPAFLPHDWGTATTVLALFGKFWIAAAFMLLFQVAAELYPTPLRSQGMGTSSTISAFFMIFLPYLTYLGMYGPWIPMIILGIGCILASVTVSFLPETLHQNLPQTEEEAEVFGLGKEFWSYAGKPLVKPLEKSGGDTNENVVSLKSFPSS